MKKIPFVLFWCLFFVFVASNLPRLLDYEPRKENPSRVEEFSAEQKRLLEIHNQMRVSRRLKPLEIDNKLCEYAQNHAGYMASRNNLTHSSMNKLQEFCGAGTVGENIAWGQETPESVVSAWMWSPMHRWNILGSSYTKAGFGVKKDSDGRNYWCVVFSD